ncbi:DUF4342 domain-containing protein [candidate division WOR-3 bacterium]|uniref:DUF4342 domain-containing protein n=1 Tax=candidate division WOR-3 bacterium TaxID=2052148 RepID=A0A937XHV5_UNCW3|nr:DUF4342 domain-containing protein [candidate division WOR-3 bacterium]
MDEENGKSERTWSEEIEVAGAELVDHIKELVKAGNVRRVILRTPDNKLLLEIPLTAGAVAGGVVVLVAPVLAALGALAALVAKVKIQVIRLDRSNP